MSVLYRVLTSRLAVKRIHKNTPWPVWRYNINGNGSYSSPGSGSPPYESKRSWGACFKAGVRDLAYYWKHGTLWR